MKSFNGIEFSNWNNNLLDSIKKEIEQKPKDYILGIDEEEFKKYIIDKYTFELLTIDTENETVTHSVSKDWLQSEWDERYQTDVYTFVVKYPYTGSVDIFSIRPSVFNFATTDINIDINASIVSFSFKLYKRDPLEYARIKEDRKIKAFANLNNANNDVKIWNANIGKVFSSIFKMQKTKYLEENYFFAAINLKVNVETASIFTAPTVKKKDIPQPIVSKNKEFSSEPIMSKEMYDDILKVVYDSGKSMEKKTSLYNGKDEEGLRDQFIFVLETRYAEVTATGETFNRGGKTDIILKYAKDGSNLFVAECKFWHGAEEFLKAISQLFDRYLTWRDSKVALIMFVKNKDFTNVLSTIKTEAKNHPYFLKETGSRGESSFSYLFSLPQDKNKHVFLEIIAFHYDK